MTAQAMSNQAGAVPVESPTFERFGGLCAILAGVAGFVYAVAFIILRSDGLSALCLLLVGLFTTAALPAAYLRLREIDAGFVLWALRPGGRAGHGQERLAGREMDNVDRWRGGRSSIRHPPGTLLPPFRGHTSP